jgi:hypothetical protein
MPDPAVPAVKYRREAREQGAHRSLERALARLHQQMEVVGHQRPREDLQLALANESGEAPNEIRTVLIVVKDRLPIDPPGHYVVQNTGRVEATSARHDSSASQDAAEGGEAVR